MYKSKFAERNALNFYLLHYNFFVIHYITILTSSNFYSHIHLFIDSPVVADPINNTGGGNGMKS
jgi:hypothetical protein